MAAKKKKAAKAKPITVAPGQPIEGNLIRRTLTVEQVLANFPFAKPRPIQVEAIEKVVEAYNAGQHYVFLEVPVGGGKSGIALAMARTLNDAFLVTLTEQLQNQYMKDFEHYGLRVLKGRGKYQCSSCAGSCALGKTLKLECSPCPYQTAKTMALSSRFMVCNYHSFLANVGGHAGLPQVEAWREHGTLPKHHGDRLPPPPPRKLAIWDEAHTIESFLLEQQGLDVNLTSLALAPREPIPYGGSDPRPYFDWLEKALLPALRKELEDVVDPREKERLSNFESAVLAALARREIDDWIPEHEAENGTPSPEKFSLKPLQVSAYGHHLWGWADFSIFMSGTILSAWQMVQALGLNPEKGEHVVMPSPFPAKNRPIYAGDLDMTYKARDESWPLMAEQVDALMTRHTKEKGLLLCPSNAMIDFIEKHLSATNRVRFLKASGAQRLPNYQQHLESTAPTILAAPGLWEGADLKGDASRFQILPAVPRAFFKGQTEARARIDRTWYRWVTYTKLLQGIGRSVRDEKDYAATYILDKDFLKELHASDTMIPAWVKEAVIEGIPKGVAPSALKAMARAR